MPAKKQETKKTSTIVYVFWILIAIIGTGSLFLGLQSSAMGDSIVTSVMFIVIGIILIFLGLIMVLGKANIEADDVVVKKEDK